MMIIPVILSGGSGTRLLPLSTPEKPKQFLALVTQNSLLQETILRCQKIENIAPPVIIGNEKHKQLFQEQLHKIGVSADKIILEPIGRNTAPAIAVAAMYALHCSEEDSDPVLFVMPSDHVIQNITNFKKSVAEAKAQADSGQLITFGIVPTRADINYGYIHRGEQLSNLAYKVAKFVEKPKEEKAQEYFRSKEYYWNSGMFMFRAQKYLLELAKYAPDILSASEKSYMHSKKTANIIKLEKARFEKCRSDSIDYAVMEKTDAAAVVSLDAGWSDVGSWKVLAEISKNSEVVKMARQHLLEK